jgi:integrase
VARRHLEQRLAAGTIALRTVIANRGATAHLRGLRRVPVDELTADDVDRLTARMAAGGNPRRPGTGYSASAIRGVVLALRCAIAAAARKGLVVDTGAAGRAELPASRSTAPPVVTPDLAAAVLARIDGHRDHRLVLVILLLGLRISEALGMTWDDVDLDAGHVRIRQQLQRLDGRWMLRPTNTHADAYLALPAAAAAALAEQRRVQVAEQLAAGSAWRGTEAPGALVWRRADGQPVHASTVSRLVKRACRDAGVDLAIHSFGRHGHATLQRLAGATLDDVREQLRHRQASTTLIYTHVVPQMRRQSAARMDRVLRKP